MELLLNLAWLLLALPACWLWRRSARAQRSSSSMRSLLALSCMLVVLFPVISATDDLRSMHADMEESPASKRSFHHATTDRAPFSGRLQSPPAILRTELFFSLLAGLAALPTTRKFSLTFSPLLPVGRAPPSFHFA